MHPHTHGSVDAGDGRQVPADEHRRDAEGRYVPFTLAECLATDPKALGDRVHQFVIDFQEALEQHLAPPIAEMIAKLVTAKDAEDERWLEERERELIAALAERFPMVGPALREVVAHLHTSDFGDTPWNCPGGICRRRPIGDLRSDVDRILAQAPSFDLLPFLTRRLAEAGGIPLDVRREQEEFDRHQAELRRLSDEIDDRLEGLAGPPGPPAMKELLDKKEATDGRLWVAEYDLCVELLIAHMPGLETVLRLLWGHVREPGFQALMQGQYCCAAVVSD